MKTFYLILLVFLVWNYGNIVQSTQIESNRNTSSAAQSFNIAQKLYNENKFTQAEIELKKAIDLDNTYAPSYHLLANIYLKKGTIQDRSDAEKVVREAIRLMPDSVNYHITLVTIYKAQGFKENAQKYLENLLEKFPYNPELLYLLGNLYQENAERLHCQVSALQIGLLDTNYVNQFRRYNHSTAMDFEYFRKVMREYYAKPIISFERDYQNELRKTRETYNKLHSIEPHYKDLDRQFALIAYEESNWKKMIDCAHEFIQNHPENRNSYLISGLAYLRSGDYAQANKAFTDFRERLLPYERSYFEQFDKFLAENEQKAINKMTSDKQSKFHKTFWLSRDPLFLTDYNERILEHYGRVAEAYLLFSVPGSNIEGWQTDRGVIWVRYGSPNRRVKNLNLQWDDVLISKSMFDDEFPLENQKFNRRSIKGRFNETREDEVKEDMYEFWYYDTFTFMFYEHPLRSGIFKLFENRTYSNREFAAIFQKQQPERFVMKIPGKRIDFPRFAADFRGKGSKTQVELFYGIPIVSLYHAKKENEYIAYANQGVFLFDEDWNERLRDVWKIKHVSPIEIDSADTKLLTIQNHMEVNPGIYNLAIEFKDDSSGNIGATREGLVVAKYGYDSLQVSSLLLASNIEPKPSAALITIDNLNYTPSIDRTFKKPQTIFLYFEIYNLKITSIPGESKYQLEYGVQYKKSPTDKEWLIGKALGKLFSFSKNKFELATTAEYTGSNPVENMYIEIDPTSLNPGIYQLTLKVTDQLVQKTTEKKTIFYLKE